MAKVATKPDSKETASTKLAKGGGAKADAKAKPAEKLNPLPKDDLFVKVAKETENLTEKQAFEQVRELAADIEQNSFRLGGVLAVILDKGYVGEYDNFKSLVQDRFGIHYRKAMYLINIYTNLVQKQIPWSVVKDLGWTKLKELAPILTQKNAESWAKRAKGLTVLQLQEAVRKALGKGGDASNKGGGNVGTITFKVHDDQRDTIREALDKAKKETKTEVDTVALTNICTAYNGGAVEVELSEKAKGKEPTKKEKQATLKALFTDLGYRPVLKVFEEVFPNIDLTVEVKEGA